ncbi:MULTISPECIES: 3-keto-5-aminohexanoate cleavage protein [Actinosynnema]|uniref:3-keto-5-aminohexanoate cleavage protein n=1 Tax=Actinosynnema TaxID=40566 RepID=UPI0020A3D1DA|nr:3-keto-5-aminohexanoate cleavage protein [Actinosynnema pretiosum]
MIIAAPAGVARGDVPHLPVAPGELLTAALACEQVGASVVRVDVRGPDGLLSLDPGLAAEDVAALREGSSLAVLLSLEGPEDAPDADRLRVLDALPDSASFALGAPGSDGADRWEFAVAAHEATRERGIVPEYGISGAGQLALLRRLLDERGLPAGGLVHVGLVLGAPGGLPGDADTLVSLVRELPEGALFSATGLDRAGLPVLLAALASGGHLRVGLADTPEYAEGQRAQSTTQLVARAAGVARIAQRPPLSGAQARELLGRRAPVRV